MDSERWKRLSRLFDEWVDLDVGERDLHLAVLRANDPDLAEELKGMLAAADDESVLDSGTRRLVIDDDDPPQSQPKQLGSWVLGKELGRGSMGLVFKAERELGDITQRAAIKLLRRRWDGSAHAQRFLLERRILAKLNHPNIPKLIDHGIDEEGRPWIAQAFVDGIPLVDWANQEQLDLPTRIDLMRKVCSAVQHAHEHFVVHRDLKPGNILVDASGEPHVLDFGAAKRIDMVEEGTRTGMFAGFTPEYAAPEQVKGAAITAATDVYALGTMLYVLVTGVLPMQFDATNLYDVTDTITSRAPEPAELAISRGSADDRDARLAARQTSLHDYRSFVRGDLARILQVALAKEPHRRYGSVLAFSADLKRFLTGRPVSVVGDTFAYRTSKWVRRNRGSVIMACIALIAILAGIGGMAWQIRQTQREAAANKQMVGALLNVLRKVDQGREQNVPRAILDEAVRHLKTLPKGSATRLELADTVSAVLFSRGYGRTAMQLIESELGTRVSGHGLKPGNELTMFNNWVMLQQQNGNYAPARAALNTAIAEQTAAPLGQQIDMHARLVSLALSENEGATAYDAARTMLDLRKQLAKDSDPRPGDMMEYAAALVASRHDDEGLKVAENTLANLPGSTNPGIRSFVLNMTALRRSLFGQFEAADTLYREAEQIDVEREPGDSEFFWFSNAVNQFDMGQLSAADEILARIEKGAFAREAHTTAAGYAGRSEHDWLRGEIKLAEGDRAAAARAFEQGERALAEGTSADHRQQAYLAALAAIAWLGVDPVKANDAMQRAKALATQAPAKGSYAEAMTLAAEGRRAQSRGAHRDAVQAFDHALEVLEEGRKKPLVLEFQLKENRDELRIRQWRAKSVLAAGDAAAADTGQVRIHALVARLGAAHPYAPK